MSGLLLLADIQIRYLHARIFQCLAELIRLRFKQLACARLLGEETHAHYLRGVGHLHFECSQFFRVQPNANGSLTAFYAGLHLACDLPDHIHIGWVDPVIGRTLHHFFAGQTFFH